MGKELVKAISEIQEGEALRLLEKTVCRVAAPGLVISALPIRTGINILV